MTEFEALLQEYRGPVERFVKFRISSTQDAEDILQETYLAAFRNLGTIRDPGQFKSWLLGIAKNKCNDFYRQESHRQEVPLEEALTMSRVGLTERQGIRDTMASLGEEDRRLMYLYYIYGLDQAEISEKLCIPVGTVKSRLHRARGRFRQVYLSENNIQGKDAKIMKKLPEILPEYTIRQLNKEPFAVKWEELLGWFIVPRLGEKRTYAAYDFPSRKRSESVEMEVVGRARVHGVEGVEISAREYDPEKKKWSQSSFVAQLTDTHCRYLAETHMADGVKECNTFLDGDEFLPNWGFGPDNCGSEVNQYPKGDIVRTGDILTTADKPYLLDIVGRYEVTLDGMSYDTVCLVFIDPVDSALCEQYLDSSGRTILWRRYNPDNWDSKRYGKPWTELLPDNSRIVVNGETYVHWYDCITDYILR